MHTNHPILYYIPDLESYSEYRGVYFDVNDLPGPASDKSDDIISWINNIHLIQERYYDKYQEYKNWVCAHDDGYSANRVVDIVFRNNLENKNILDISYTNKIKILMYGSTLLTNGVTSTLLNRLDNIDYNKYDVSLIVFNRPKKERNNANVLAVNSNVRVLCRIGSFSATLKETFNWKYIYKHGLYSERAKKRCPFALFERDFFRSYGNSSFDYVLDYSGYSIYYPLLLTQAKGAKRIIWEHNDLNKDINNLDKNNQKSYLQHRSNVLGAISTYPLFDKIVSVGYSAMIENRKHFATSETYNRFTFVNNLVDGDLVLKQIHNYDSVEYDNIQYYVDHKLEKNSTDWFINLNKTARKHILKTPIPLKDNINFVNMGRYSSEKNQLNLILAFAKLHQKYPNTRLYIIGEGDMRNIYERTIRDCNLQNKVYLTGRLSNPFALMNLCQCFILPSLYEGLCTAVIEARILNLPIILSKFSTSKDVSLPNGQYRIRRYQ